MITRVTSVQNQRTEIGSKLSRYCILIPAYNPDERLVELVAVLDDTAIEHIVIVNDGSHTRCKSVFDRVSALPKATVLEHCTNLGKGAALKLGLNFLYCNMHESTSVVTADADGQHLAEDIARIGEKSVASQNSLVLGTRFSSREGRGVPLRSALGNIITKLAVRLFAGIKVADTQTGLRSIPKTFIPRLLAIKSNGYEFELDMLLETKVAGLPVDQIPISTIYLENNRSSHFNPIVDSLLIGFTFLRYGISSIATASIDFLVFILLFPFFGNILFAQYTARTVAGIFNFVINRNFVFRASGSVFLAAIKYCTLVYVMAIISHGVIILLSQNSLYPIPVTAAKAVAECLLFPCTFALQREFIFSMERKWQNG